MSHLLEVRNLSVRFHTVRGIVEAVRNVSWHVDRGETLAILGVEAPITLAACTNIRSRISSTSAREVLR